MRIDTTIGFFLATIHTGASREMWPAILDEAARSGVNLVCFPGGRLDEKTEFENQRNAVYELADPGYLDGILSWASSLGGQIEASRLESFHQAHASVPTMLMTQRLHGFPVVRIDAYTGMRNLVDHLITVHGMDRIAFIRGPAEHQSAQERYAAFLDALAGRGIPCDMSLVIGPYRWDAGDEAVREILDARNLVPGHDFKALIGASDLLAFKAVQALATRGYSVPGDIAVAGFNDTIESRLSHPPMTTVAMPFQAQGTSSLGILLELLAGKTIAQDTVLASRLVVRQSCGCDSSGLSLAGRIGSWMPRQASAPETADSSWQAHFLSLAAELLESAGLVEDRALNSLLAAFESDLQLHTSLTEGSVRQPLPAVLQVFEGIMDAAAARSSDLSVWQGVLSLLRQSSLEGSASQRKDAIENLLHQSRVSLADRIQRLADIRHWRYQHQAEALRESGKALFESHSMEELAGTMVTILPRFEIPGAWLVLYGTKEGVTDTTSRTLFLSWHDGVTDTLPEGGQRFGVDELVPSENLPWRKPWSLVVEPLFYKNIPMGYAVFEAGNRDGSVYEELRAYLSSSIRGITLFNEAENARRTAEKADMIKTRLLANVSHELRSPLNLILGHVRNAERNADDGLRGELECIESNARNQLRVVNDLLDLSRAEIDELDLQMEYLDVVPVLRDVFQDFADSIDSGGPVAWRLDIPARMPVAQIDPARLRQVFLNLLSNAARHTVDGFVELGAELEPDRLHLWVRDTGCGIPADQQERIFEPFVSSVSGNSAPGGIGLGLSIARHMVALHLGQLSLESIVGYGSTFHIRLPLPNLARTTPQSVDADGAVLLCLCHASEVPAEVRALAASRGLAVVIASRMEDLDDCLSGTCPAILAWDMASARQGDWLLIKRLRQHPALFQAPFIIYGNPGTGLTGLLSKPAAGEGLSDIIARACPHLDVGPVYIVDDEPAVRQALAARLSVELCGHGIRTFESGGAAIEAMRDEIPGLVILDFSMPGLSGADVLDMMRLDERLRHVPALVLSNKVFNSEDIKRLERSSRVVLQHKGVWTDAETDAAVSQMLFGGELQPAHASAMVKRVVQYLNEHYREPISRWQVADSVHVSEDYLSRIFSRELGITPWEYLNRYRVWQAGRLLAGSGDSIGSIALKTGFSDQAYFSRVFRKITGQSPQAFRQKA